RQRSHALRASTIFPKTGGRHDIRSLFRNTQMFRTPRKRIATLANESDHVHETASSGGIVHSTGTANTTFHKAMGSKLIATGYSYLAAHTRSSCRLLLEQRW